MSKTCAGRSPPGSGSCRCPGQRQPAPRTMLAEAADSEKSLPGRHLLLDRRPGGRGPGERGRRRGAPRPGGHALRDRPPDSWAPDETIGTTVSTLAEARTAARQGADSARRLPHFFHPDQARRRHTRRSHPPAGNPELRIPAPGGHRRHHPRERRPGHRGRGRHDLRHFPGGHAPRCLLAVERFQKLFAGE